MHLGNRNFRPMVLASTFVFLLAVGLFVQVSAADSKAKEPAAKVKAGTDSKATAANCQKSANEAQMAGVAKKLRDFQAKHGTADAKTAPEKPADKN